jgi:hypothetical protein
LGLVVDYWPCIVMAYWPYSLDALTTPASRHPDQAPSKATDPVWYSAVVLKALVKKALLPDGQEWLHVRISSKHMNNKRLNTDVAIMNGEAQLCVKLITSV